MTLQPQYRLTAYALAAVFAVFSIGLPIVVASCPMPKAEGAMMCVMCNDSSDGTARLSNSVDRSCCVTRYAADRNRTEFLQVQHAAELIKTIVPAVILHFDFANNTLARVQPVGDDAGPPLTIDIPIFISSLLI